MTHTTRPTLLRVEGRHGWAELTDTGALTRLELAGLSMIQYPATELEAGASGLWLRRYEGERITTVVPLLGPGSGARAQSVDEEIIVRGRRDDLAWTVVFRLVDAEPGWVWQVGVTSARPMTVDLVAAVDPALAPYGAVRTNEYYVSQYLDLTSVETATGPAIAVRQNMPGEQVPWLLFGSTGRVSGWATDSLQLVTGNDPRGGLSEPLPSRRLQHEHSLAVLSSERTTVRPGEELRCAWFGVLEPDHQAASGPDDATVSERASSWPELSMPCDQQRATGPYESASLFSPAAVLDCTELSIGELEELLGPVTVVESSGDTWWSALTGTGESVTSAGKELAVLRPHGHILRTGSALQPDPDALTATVWMRGSFAGQVTRGHAALSPLFSASRSYLALQMARGLRVFVDTGSGWRLLDRPSAWGVTSSTARWLYRHADGIVNVTTTAGDEAHALTCQVSTGGVPTRIMLAAHLGEGEDGASPTTLEISDDGASVTLDTGSLELAWSAAEAGDDAPLFLDHRSRGLSWLTLQTTDDAALVVRAAVPDAPRPTASLWRELREGLDLRLPSGPLADSAAAMSQVLPWFAQNAVVHFLSPRGLEQYSGGAWGTRDVCQGPVGLLLAHGRLTELRSTIAAIFAGQTRDGTWPQAFEFLSPHPWHADSAHGDVVYWPLLALGDYLVASQDASLLAQAAASVDDPQPTSISVHVATALDAIEASMVPGRTLPAYGHGDWNDSLQPADPRLAQHMVSTWTAILQGTALRTLATGLDQAGTDPWLAQRARGIADRTDREVQDLLLVDGLLAGYGVFADDGSLAELLVHPRDTRTGLQYGILPWIHAISADLLTPDQAAHHLRMIDEQLHAPDGARLFNRPSAYRGGPMSVFQRAEAATFWGREIGLMYTHAHLRYAEALARYGDAAGLFAALGQAHPRGITARVPSARPRQDTCYFSSSDAVFADRYDAEARYDLVARGEIPVEGGWRVYSSGPGLFLRLVVECLLGVRRRGHRVELDPVLDPRLDGLEARVVIGDRVRTARFVVRGTGCGVRRVVSDGRQIAAEPLQNPYREPGVTVDLADLGDVVEIEVGR